MNKKLLVFALLFVSVLILSVFVSAQNVLVVSLDIDKGDNVDLRRLRMEHGTPPFFIHSGDYTIQFLDSNRNILINKSLEANFCVLSDPPVCSDKTSVSPEFDFDERVKTLKLFHNGVEIFQSEINLCNSNGVCDINFETFLSCPQDCPLVHNDDICLADEDGFCDPDCWKGVDPDCENEFYPYAGENKDVKIGESIRFRGEVRNAGSGTYTYKWHFSYDLSTEFGQEVTHKFNREGINYGVTLTVTNQDGVYKEDTLLVTVTGPDREEEVYPTVVPEQPEQPKKESIIDKILALWGKITSLFRK